MRLKNILIVVEDIENSKKFYNELFGLQVVLENEGNVILNESLVLQEKKIWEEILEVNIIKKNNATELYFECSNIEDFVEKLEKYYPDVKYITKLNCNAWGNKIIRFYDLDGNLIEVGESSINSYDKFN